MTKKKDFSDFLEEYAQSGELPNPDDSYDPHGFYSDTIPDSGTWDYDPRDGLTLKANREEDESKRETVFENRRRALENTPYTPKAIREETDHYTTGEIECVDYLWSNQPFEAFVGGLEWNIKKYLHRWRYKAQPVKDLRKARDYLSVMIDVMEGKEPEFKEWK